ncbi:MAG: hypothetical protein JO356_18715 [Acidobacteria bacterium]|nr:hypothetical protein [Acidobacteriota bacterium]
MVPSLKAGDRLRIHPDLPDTQSVHYLMVVVFLRGATNPPPDSWFIRAETWTKPVNEEGILVTVPEEAEQSLILLAPETGGAFSTLRAAVRGKPGAFVRAAQDLDQASLDRARLEAYLAAVRETSIADPEQLKSRTTSLARSLNIKLDQQCFDKPSAQQVPCLTQNTDQLVLDDAHSQTMVTTLTSGASTDLLTQISSTPTAHSGYYSPYIGAVVDVVRILSTTHTAQYQYIPALGLAKSDELSLRLNNPPSFRNPKSVIVVGLPPIRPAVLPPLRAMDASQVFCGGKPGLVLPLEGAPLVFATELGHNYVLHIDTGSGKTMDIPAHPDPARAGFVLEAPKPDWSGWEGEATGILRGIWGFQPFDGPHFRMRASRPAEWVVATKDVNALIVGREDVLHLRAPDASCVSSVQVSNGEGRVLPVEWKLNSNEELELKVALENADPGVLQILVKKYGTLPPDRLVLHTYSEAAHLAAFSIHAGDTTGLLTGTRLDQVTGLEFKGITFDPGELSRAEHQDELKLIARNPADAAKFTPAEPLLIRVTLRDGRLLDLNATVEDSRPKLTLLTKSIQLADNDSPSTIQVGSPDELPQNARLNFFLKTQVPESFSPGEKIQISTPDGSFHADLSVKDGTLTLQDSKTIFAVLDPVKMLGPSAFGPLKFRPVTEQGLAGDWLPLVNLVRVPELKGIRCVPAPANDSEPEPSPSEPQCTLTGDKLFLIDAVSADPDFTKSVTVPDGFANPRLNIPQPKGKVLYLKLRDDPATVDSAVVPMLSAQP